MDVTSLRFKATYAADEPGSAQAKKKFLSADQLEQLASHRTAFIARRFWREVELFERLVRRNMQQHRTSVHMRKAQLVVRICQRLRWLGMDRLLPERARKDADNSASVLLQKVLVGLVGAHALLHKLLESIDAAYASCRSVASQTYFMAVMLSMCGALARMRLTAGETQRSVSAAFEAVGGGKSFGLPASLRSFEFNKFVEKSNVQKVDLQKDPQTDRSCERSFQLADSIETGGSGAAASDAFWNLSESMSEYPSESVSAPKKKQAKKNKPKNKSEIDDIFAALE